MKSLKITLKIEPMIKRKFVFKLQSIRPTPPSFFVIRMRNFFLVRMRNGSNSGGKVDGWLFTPFAKRKRKGVLVNGNDKEFDILL